MGEGARGGDRGRGGTAVCRAPSCPEWWTYSGIKTETVCCPYSPGLLRVWIGFGGGCTVASPSPIPQCIAGDELYHPPHRNAASRSVSYFIFMFLQSRTRNETVDQERQSRTCTAEQPFAPRDRGGDKRPPPDTPTPGPIAPLRHSFPQSPGFQIAAPDPSRSPTAKHPPITPPPPRSSESPPEPPRKSEHLPRRSPGQTALTQAPVRREKLISSPPRALSAEKHDGMSSPLGGPSGWLQRSETGTCAGEPGIRNRITYWEWDAEV